MSCARRLAVVSAAGLALSAASIASADQTFYDWTGNLSNAWSNAGNWDPAGVPNVAGEVALFHGGSTCDLDISVTVDKLGNGVGDTLNMLNDRDLTIIGNPAGNGDAPTGIFSIYGVVNMLATANATDIRVQGDTLTIGNIDDFPAVINMSNSSANRIIGAFGTESVTFDDSLLVRGSGQIGANTLRINNHGTIRADQPTQLIVDPNASGFFNFGEMAAEAGGTLRLEFGDYDNTGGLIVARDGSVVFLNAPTIFGAGSIQTFGTGVIRVGTTGTSTRLNALTINGTLEMPNDLDVVLTGATSVSTLNMLATSNDTRIYIDGPVTFTGAINMSNSLANVISNLGGSLPGDYLTLTSATVRGSGQLGANTIDITNHSNIISDQTTILAIDPVTTLVNMPTGLIAAQNGGTLRLEAANYDNQGVIAANGGSLVQLNGCTVNGLLGGTGSGYFDVLTIGTSTALENVTMTQRLNLSNDRDVLIRGPFVNGQSIDMGATSNDTRLYIDGPVTFSGGGVVNMSNSIANVISSLGGSLAGDYLVNQNNLIRGSGQIGINSLNVTNQSIIRADYAGGTLFLDPVATFTNQGSIEAVNGGIVQLAPGDFQNTGSISATGGSRIDLNACALNGNLIADASSFFNVLTIGTSTVLHDFTLVGRLVQSNDRDLLVYGSFQHTGDWDVQGTSNDTRVYIDGPVTLDGGGTMNLSNSIANVISNLGGSLPDDFLTIADYTIHGAGQIGLNSIDIANDGLISADVSSLLYIDPSTTFTNTGLVQAINDSTLRLEPGLHDHTNGLLALHDQSRCDLNACTITGNLTADGDAYFNVLTIGTSTLFEEVNLTGRLVQTNDRDLLVRGAFTHAGNWDVLGTSNDTRVYIDGPVTLTGGGAMNLSNSISNVISSLGGSLPDDFLTIADYTIHGAGQIGLNALDVSNAGAITADQTAVLILDPAATFDNAGAIHSIGSGGLRLDSGAYTNSGSVVVDAGSKIDLTFGSYTQTAGQTVVNGEFESDPNLLTFEGGSVSGVGLLDSNITNNAATFAPGNSIGTLSVEGNYTQGAGATLEVELAAGENDVLVVSGTATMGGLVRAIAAPGFVPTLGQQFVILTAATVGGNEPAATAVNFPFGRTVQVVLEPDRVKLIVVNGCIADWNGDTVLDFFDVQGFLNSWASHQPEADLNDDTLFDFFDVQTFLGVFSAGCP